MRHSAQAKFWRGLLLAVLVTAVVSILSGTEEIGGIGSGEFEKVAGVRLLQYGLPVGIMGHLTADGNVLPGTTFFLYYQPNGSEECGEPSFQCEYVFPKPVSANGAQIAFVLHPNGLVCFMIGPDQFRPGYPYPLPFLPEDPTGGAVVEFF
jgi:hypothetical protein